MTEYLPIYRNYSFTVLTNQIPIKTKILTLSSERWFIFNNVKIVKIIMKLTVITKYVCVAGFF